MLLFKVKQYLNKNVNMALEKTKNSRGKNDSG